MNRGVKEPTMRWMIIVPLALAALQVIGCGSGRTSDVPTVPQSAYSTAPLPQVEPVRGDDHMQQALEGSIARFVQWTNRHYGKSVLDTKADNACHSQQVEDLWSCYVTVIIEPHNGFKAARQTARYTVTRDTEKNELIFLAGGAT
jgi:hypothetical protein